jgi:hypothetical protein
MAELDLHDGVREVIVRFKSHTRVAYEACAHHHNYFPQSESERYDFVVALDFETNEFVMMHLECWNKFWHSRNTVEGEPSDISQIIRETPKISDTVKGVNNE